MITRIKNKFLKGETASNSITKAAFLIAGMGLASRALGMIRDRILASTFGAGDVLDSYYAAFKIPDLVFNLLILGALSSAFVPVFTSLVSKDKEEEAWGLANIVLSVGLVALVFISTILFFNAGLLVDWLTFGFNDEKKQMVETLTKIMLASPIIFGISGIFGGILNSFKKFFFYSLAPLFYNLGIIIGAVFLTKFWGYSGLAWGVVLGALLHLLTQAPEVLRCGLKFRFSIDLKNPNLRKVGKLMIPRTMGLGVTQVNLLIVTVLASTLESGSLTVFNFANNLQAVPLGVFGISFALAAFPTLSSYWARDEKELFARNFSKTFRRIMFFIIPSSIFIIVLRAQIVRVILGAGNFDWNDTIATFQALGIFTLSLFAQSLIPLLARTFYAIHDTKTPFVIGIFSEAINLILALFLINQMHEFRVLGLVWAFSISTIINMFLLLVILHRRLGNLNEKEIIGSIWKTLISAIFGAVVAQGLKVFVGNIVDMQTFLGVFSQLAISLLGGGITFIVVGKMLKLSELEYFMKKAGEKFFFNKVLVSKEKEGDEEIS